MNKLRVRVTEPLIRVDLDDNVLDVSHKMFEKDPKAVYEVPDTIFWRRLEEPGKITNKKPLLVRVGRVAASDEEDEIEDTKPTPKPKTEGVRREKGGK